MTSRRRRGNVVMSLCVSGVMVFVLRDGVDRELVCWYDSNTAV